MERFKGLAILATNRRKDLDEAFLRRLRYVLEFPIPGVVERERIWRAGILPACRCRGSGFLLPGQALRLHRRSHPLGDLSMPACRPPTRRRWRPLPAGKVGRLRMRDVLVQVKRELDKLSRAAGDEQFGIYAPRLAEWTT